MGSTTKWRKCDCDNGESVERKSLRSGEPPLTVHDGFVESRLDSLYHQARFLLLDEP